MKTVFFRTILHLQQEPLQSIQAFIIKLRVFLISCQDASQEWLRKEFPDLFMIESIRTYPGMFGGSDPGSDLDWVNENIRFDHGPLCDVYPHEGMGCTGVCERDSPAFHYRVSANEFDIEGLIVETGCWKKIQSSTAMLEKIVDAYGEVYTNLCVHADGYPKPEFLQSSSVMGQTGRHLKHV